MYRHLCEHKLITITLWGHTLYRDDYADIVICATTLVTVAVNKHKKSNVLNIHLKDNA